jgi:hypothetical protein
MKVKKAEAVTERQTLNNLERRRRNNAAAIKGSIN